MIYSLATIEAGKKLTGRVNTEDIL
jgi:hypothetical protein